MRIRFLLWLEHWTTLRDVARNFVSEPATGFAVWARTTGGIVALLILLQLTTGILLASYYVPAATAAYTTVAYIEKVVRAGSWIRSLHVYCSQLLPLALALHLAQMFFIRAGYRRHLIAWFASIILLALALAAGATGYALPFDARAINGIHVADGLTRATPLIGAQLERWLLVGNEISTLTLSRFYALHVFLTPTLILFTIIARLFIFRERISNHAAFSDLELRWRAWLPSQLARQAYVIGIAFVALAIYAAKFPAALAPAPEFAPYDYLPRPGAQFLWLFELLKFFDGATATIFAIGLTTLLFGGLVALPFFNDALRARFTARKIGGALFIFGALLIGGLTVAALLGDRLNQNVRAQLAQQDAADEVFRRAPFRPIQRSSRTSKLDTTNKNKPDANLSDGTNRANPATSQLPSPDISAPPNSYTQNCAKCHGGHGEGVAPHPKLIGISAQPNRTVEDIINILNNPAAYGLEKPMPSFAKKLSDDEKKQIAEWVVKLK